MKIINVLICLLLASVSHAQIDKQKQQFYKQDIEKINDLVTRRVVGRVNDFLIGDYLSIYAHQSQYLLYADLKAHTSSSVRLTDSFLYSLVFNQEQVAEIDAAVEQHKDQLMLDKQPGHETTHLGSFAYFGSRIYLLYSVMNFYGMKKQDGMIAKRSDTKSVYFYQKHLVELKVTSEGLLVERTQRIDMDDNTGVGFDIMDDVPALFFKSKVGDKDKYEYIKLPGEWNKQALMPAFPDMLSTYLTETHFYNQYTLNHGLNILMNNTLKQKIKIATGTMKVGVFTTSMAVHGEFVYTIVFNNSEKKMHLYKVDLGNNKSTLVNSYTCAKEFNMYSIKCLYVDKVNNILYLIEINTDKQLEIVDAIKL